MWYKKSMRKTSQHFTIPKGFFLKMTVAQLDELDADTDASNDKDFQYIRYVKKNYV